MVLLNSHDFSMTHIIFHNFPGPANGLTEFHDFQQPEETLLKACSFLSPLGWYLSDVTTISLKSNSFSAFQGEEGHQAC